jgi:hypothetical protein
MDGPRWTEEVDGLVDAGDVDGAVALLESVVVSDLSTTPAADPRLAAALGDLAGLHASRGGALRADELRARAAALRSRAAAPGALGFVRSFPSSRPPLPLTPESTYPTRHMLSHFILFFFAGLLLLRLATG